MFGILLAFYANLYGQFYCNATLYLDYEVAVYFSTMTLNCPYSLILPNVMTLIGPYFLL